MIARNRCRSSRGSRDGEDDWSSAFDAEGKPIANTWQGIFPVYNTNEDGYGSTAPVGCLKPNGYGLHDMIGNVWECTSDWYRPYHPREKAINPSGPELQDMVLTRGQSPSRVIKGGSYLICALPTTAPCYRPAPANPGGRSRRRASWVSNGIKSTRPRGALAGQFVCRWHFSDPRHVRFRAAIGAKTAPTRPLRCSDL